MRVCEMASYMGTRIRFSEILVREFTGLTKVTWVPKPCPDQEGWVVGFRWLGEGKIDRGGYDEPPIFTRTKAIPCVLVTTEPRKKPHFIPINALPVESKHGA